MPNLTVFTSFLAFEPLAGIRNLAEFSSTCIWIYRLGWPWIGDEVAVLPGLEIENLLGLSEKHR